MPDHLSGGLVHETTSYCSLAGPDLFRYCASALGRFRNTGNGLALRDCFCWNTVIGGERVIDSVAVHLIGWWVLAIIYIHAFVIPRPHNTVLFSEQFSTSISKDA